MGYQVNYAPDEMKLPPTITTDESGTTSWRDAKKALRQWYLDQAKALRSVSETDYFPK